MSIETRTYADADRARAAIDELSSKGFSDVKASFNPDRVRVVVNAHFGEGRNAAQILDRHGPLTADEAGSEANDDSDLFASRAPSGPLSKVQDPATPLSNILGLPVLTKGLSRFAPKSLIHDPAPLSTWLGWPTLFGATGGARKGPVASPPDSPSKDKEASSATPVAEKTEQAASGAPLGEGPPDNSLSHDQEAASPTPVGRESADSPSKEGEASSETPAAEGRPPRERRRPPHLSS